MAEPLPKDICATLYLDELAADSSKNWGDKAQCNLWTQCKSTPEINSDGIVENIGGICIKMSRDDYRSKLTSVTYKSNSEISSINSL